MDRSHRRRTALTAMLQRWYLYLRCANLLRRRRMPKCSLATPHRVRRGRLRQSQEPKSFLVQVYNDIHSRRSCALALFSLPFVDGASEQPASSSLQGYHRIALGPTRHQHRSASYAVGCAHPVLSSGYMPSPERKTVPDGKQIHEVTCTSVIQGTAQARS
jgi:hypothetical protein